MEVRDGGRIKKTTGLTNETDDCVTDDAVSRFSFTSLNHYFDPHPDPFPTTTFLFLYRNTTKHVYFRCNSIEGYQLIHGLISHPTNGVVGTYWPTSMLVITTDN